jgi:hypothetical protein
MKLLIISVSPDRQWSYPLNVNPPMVTEKMSA